MRLYKLIRRLLFLLPPETAHHWTLRLLHFSFIRQQLPAQPKTIMGLAFPNSIGLAAGLDKNGEHIDALAKLGFGFIEIGTVTPKPQLGNPKPRLFRLVKEEALINRMGFNNKGVDYLVTQVKQANYPGILGINIGKNKTTPNDKAVDDYLYCLRKVYPYASYITINISSPNTEGLRDLQYGGYLDTLLASLQAACIELSDKYHTTVPLAVKVAPDLDEPGITALANACLKHGVDAIIATNTTVSRVGVEVSLYANEAGGLSGKPLLEKSTAVVKLLAEILQGKIPIIAVGGISNAKDAKQKFVAGADLIQLYTGLIYEGPGMLKRLL